MCRVMTPISVPTYKTTREYRLGLAAGYLTAILEVKRFAPEQSKTLVPSLLEESLTAELFASLCEKFADDCLRRTPEVPLSLFLNRETIERWLQEKLRLIFEVYAENEKQDDFPEEVEKQSFVVPLPPRVWGSIPFVSYVSLLRDAPAWNLHSKQA